MVLRENMYFDPRTISDSGCIRWFGETYKDEKLLMHTQETVYLRDDGIYLYVYGLDSDNLFDEEKIDAVFTLICKIGKHDRVYRYGRKIKTA